jgi:hypothetical protein
MHDRDVPTECPPTEGSIARLRRAGWSTRVAGWTDGRGRVVYVVDGKNGKNAIRAEGSTAREAWYRAVEQAAAAVMLADWPRPTGGAGS